MLSDRERWFRKERVDVCVLFYFYLFALFEPNSFFVIRLIQLHIIYLVLHSKTVVLSFTHHLHYGALSSFNWRILCSILCVGTWQVSTWWCF